MVRGELEVLEPLHKVGPEHLPFAVEGVAAQPSGFTACQPEGPDVVKLLAQFAFVDDVGKPDGFGPVDQGKGDLGVRVVPKHRLAHQQLVEIRIDERPHDRVDLPFVVPDSCCDIDH